MNLKDEFRNISALLDQLTTNTDRARTIIDIVKNPDDYSEDELVDVINDSLHVIFK